MELNDLKNKTTAELVGISMMSMSDYIKLSMIESLQNIESFDDALIRAKDFMYAYDNEEYEDYEITEKELEALKLKAGAIVQTRGNK